MKEIRNAYETRGLVTRLSRSDIVPAKCFTNLTVDKRGATLSIGCEAYDIQLSIPFDQILKDIKEAEQ